MPRRKAKQIEELPFDEVIDPRPPWTISETTRRIGRFWLPIARKRLFRTETSYFVCHTDHDNGQVALFGPMPEHANLNDEASDLWAQSGEIEVLSDTQVETEFGKDPYINSWDDWLSQKGGN